MVERQEEVKTKSLPFFHFLDDMRQINKKSWAANLPASHPARQLQLDD